MKDGNISSVNSSEVRLDKTYIELLKHFKKNYSNKNRLYCSYMLAGQKYKNELLVVGKEPQYWPEDFSWSDLQEMEEKDIFSTLVKSKSIFGSNSDDPLRYVNDLWGKTEERSQYDTVYNTRYDPFWVFVKASIVGLRISKITPHKWPSHIALTYLYKIAYSSDRFNLDKPRAIQLDHCRKMLNLEIEILKPKRILFLTGLVAVKEFLTLPDSLAMDSSFHDLGNYKFGNHKARTIITTSPNQLCFGDLKLIFEQFKPPSKRREPALIYYDD
jgi:hypothetical protein